MLSPPISSRLIKTTTSFGSTKVSHSSAIAQPLGQAEHVDSLPPGQSSQKLAPHPFSEAQKPWEDTPENHACCHGYHHSKAPGQV